MAQNPASGRVEREVDVWGWFLFVNFLFWPRLFILGFAIFSHQIGDAFSSWVVPALGFVFFPWVTITYALMWGTSSDGVHGVVEWGCVAIAALFDIWTYGLAQRLFSRS